MECKTYFSITKSSFRLDKRKETVAYIWQTVRISDAKSVSSPCSSVIKISNWLVCGRLCVGLPSETQNCFSWSSLVNT